MKKILKIAFIFFAACCSLIFFCLTGAVIYVETDHAGHLIQKTINQSIPGSISWAGHSLSLAKGKATFNRIILNDPDENLLIGADTLTVDIIWRDLMDYILTFQQVIFENATVHLSVDEDGNVNIARAFITQETPHEKSPALNQDGTPFNVVIRRATLKNAAFHYISHNREEIVLTGLNMELKNGDLLRETAQVSLESSSGNISIPDILDIQDIRTNVRSSIEGRKLSVQALQVASGKNSLSLEGNCNFTSGKIKSALSLIVNGSFLNTSIDDIKDVGGNFIVKARVSGELNDPLVRAQLRGANLSYQDIFFDNLDTHIDYSKGYLTINRFTAGKNRSKLLLSGSTQIMDETTQTFLATPSYAFTIHDSKLFFEDIIRGLKGEINVSGSLAGDTAQYSGYKKLKGKQIDTGYQGLDEADLEVRLKGNTFFIDKGHVCVTPDENVEISGWITTGGEYDCRAETKGISFSSIDMIADREWADEKFAFSLKGKGDISNPNIGGDIDILGIAVNGHPVDPILLTFDMADMAARISGKDHPDMTATIQLATNEIDGHARFDRIDLHPAFSYAGYGEVTGFLSGSLDLSGDIGAVETIKAQVRINDLKTFWKNNELLRTENQIISVENGFISFSDIKLSVLRDGFMDLKGGADINGKVNLTADARVPVAIIEPFVEEVYDSEGFIECDVTIKGTFKEPEVRAEINLDQIGLATTYLSEPLRNTNGKIHVSQHDVTLENINGHFDAGSLNIDGVIDIKDLQLSDSEIHLAGHAVPLQVPDEMDISLNAELDIAGNKNRSEVSGDITILEGVYFRDVDLSLLSLVPGRSRSEKIETESNGYEVFEHMMLDILIGYRNPFVVENNVSLLELKPDLHLKGTPNNLILNGRARVEPGGIVKYQGREFEVTKGIIDFLNPYKTEPTIDIEGKTGIREWDIFLNVSGTPQNLSFGLRSNPLEQNNDILYLLAFGKTLRESSVKTKSTSTTQMLAAIMAEELGKNLTGSTGLDTVEVGYAKDSQNETGSEEVSVTVGKEISRRLSVKYGVETRNGQIVQRTTSEYKFLENFLLDAYNDTNGDYGAGLRYRLEFR